MRISVVIAVICSLALTADARRTRSWSYRELHDGAELVVIAVPRSTAALNQQATLPEIQQTNPDGTASSIDNGSVSGIRGLEFLP